MGGVFFEVLAALADGVDEARRGLDEFRLQSTSPIWPALYFAWVSATQACRG